MSITYLTPHTHPNLTQFFDQKLGDFTAQTGTKVNHIEHDWGQYWRELVNISIYHTGGDLAEIGSTWLESLVSMNTLRPFSDLEVRQLGGREAFFPSLWQNMSMDSKQQVWSIPYRADIRTLIYWEDMLEKAGLDPATAFSNTETFKESLITLQKHYPTPWVIPTAPTQNTIYNAASWIHASGGGFLSDNNKKTAIATPQSMDGWFSYFDLHPFMPQVRHALTDDQALAVFMRRNAAVTACGPWIFDSLNKRGLPPEILRHAKAALMPGPSFVGGTSLVIWNHARNLTDIFKFIKYLFETGFTAELAHGHGHLPVQQEFWTPQYVSSNPNLPVFREAILTGRSIPVAPLWGVIEDRLRTALSSIWSDIYNSETPPDEAKLKAILKDRIVPTARRLDITLEG